MRAPGGVGVSLLFLCVYFEKCYAFFDLLEISSWCQKNIFHNRRFRLIEDCNLKTCLEKVSARRLCLIAQRAMKQMTGYFGGYISKKQKVGKFELKKSISTLPLLQQKVEGRGVKSASTQLAHVVNRMFTTLEGKGILRVATEEFLLCRTELLGGPVPFVVADQ